MRSEALYSAFLVLYPRPFRVRFGNEMVQLFRDCYPDAKPLVFWMETLRDFAISIPREWHHEIRRGENSDIDLTLLTDALTIAAVAVPLLLLWGWFSAVILFGLDDSGQKILLLGAAGIWLIVLATLAMACLVGVLSTWAAARTGRIETIQCSKLGDCRKNTAPLLQ